MFAGDLARDLLALGDGRNVFLRLRIKLRTKFFKSAFGFDRTFADRQDRRHVCIVTRQSVRAGDKVLIEYEQPTEDCVILIAGLRTNTVGFDVNRYPPKGISTVGELF